MSDRISRAWTQWGLGLLMIGSMGLLLPFQVGFVDIGIYQFFGFLWARSRGLKVVVPTFIAVCVLIWVVRSPPAVLIEGFCFVLLLLAVNRQEFKDTVADRLAALLLCLLAIVFPLYTGGFVYWNEVAVTSAAAHASRFVIATLFCVILAEAVWLGFSVFAREPLSDFDTDNKAENSPTYTDVAVLATVMLTGITLAGGFSLFASYYSMQVEQSIRSLSDQHAEGVLVSHRIKVDAAAEQALREITYFSSLPGEDMSRAWGLVDDAYVHLAFNNQFFLQSASNIRFIGGGAGLETGDREAIAAQWSEFRYRAKMLGTGIGNSDHFYLNTANQYAPVYSRVDDATGWVVFTVERDVAGALTRSELISRNVSARFQVSDGENFSLVPSVDTSVIADNYAGGVIWKPLIGEEPYFALIGKFTDETKISIPVSTTLKERFSLELGLAETLVIDLSFKPYFDAFCRVLIAFSIFATIILLLCVWITQVMASSLVSPVLELLGALGDLQFSRKRSQSGSLIFQPVQLSEQSRVKEVAELQSRFQAMSNEVSDVQRQLNRSIRNYEELLTQLPLGVMSVDADYQVRFSNEVMRQLTGDNAEAVYKLRRHAEGLFERGIEVEEWSLKLEGKSSKHFVLAITPRLDAQGDTSGFWLLVTDLTRQKEVDAQLIQTAKLATLGEMSTGMAHELNQPLNIIKLAANNLKNSVEKGRSTPEATLNRLDRIESAIDRAAVIIDHMRAFGRVAGTDFERFDAVLAIRSMEGLLGEQLSAKGVDLRVELDAEFFVMGNPIQFEQVLINVINNARDAILDTSETGTITVSSTDEGETVVFKIEDTGGGIPPEALPHVFEPFFTTKPVGKGTGLGGSISYGIIQDMQGTIWAENWQRGARISIRLPLANASVEPS